MKVLYRSNSTDKHKISIILLDWSCRESFHMLDYLAKQTVSREQYEIIWIEYYDRQSAEIFQMLEKSKTEGRPPVVDKWIVMDVPKDVYYHKHLMYNVGIVASEGEIVVICDSDTVVGPNFVESIIKTFEAEDNIVLHLDEVRSVSRKFYPFNYPTVDDIIKNDCINFSNGKTKGLWDEEDPLHTRNYGACLCALRKDLISIGGADEHIDYLGHICGPYELTFRLINAGKKEVWHQSEFLYHTWHPGTDGHNNYLGPHDGKNMSTTALETIVTGRTFPLVENIAIKTLRTGGSDSRKNLLQEACPPENFARWNTLRLKKAKNKSQRYLIKPSLKTRWQLPWIKLLLLLEAIILKVKHRSRFKTTPSAKGFFKKCRQALSFISRLPGESSATMRRYASIAFQLRRIGVRRVAIYGKGNSARALQLLCEEFALRVKKISTNPLELNKCADKIIIASLIGTSTSAKELESAGIHPDEIVKLQ